MNRANHLFVFSFSLLKQIWCQQMNSRLCFWKKSEKKSQNTTSGSWSLKDSRCGNRIKRLESASSGRVTSSTGNLPWYSHSPPWTENRFRRTIEDTRLHTVWATALSGLYHPWRSNNTVIEAKAIRISLVRELYESVSYPGFKKFWPRSEFCMWHEFSFPGFDSV